MRLSNVHEKTILFCYLLVTVPFISLLVHFYPAWAEVNWFFVKLLKFPNQKHDSRSQKKSTFQYVINESNIVFNSRGI